ncbi:MULTISPECIES: NnrU family protein [Marinobacter]|uniref:NnrU family protein n=1 Tax=Marinobacter TaxID=2742 RepID=UPI001D070563|nr:MULTISPECIES: NnrU family protein [Marinobacter]MCK7567244.1 NnrU family protein [Marinobacter xestospongiae]UDL04088.1 NnrU family protein [Marinobacter sp. CA1]
MLPLILGLVLFLGVHCLSIVNEPLRNRLVAKLGEWPFKGLYSVIAAVGLGLVIWGYGQARLDPTPLYIPPLWLSHLAMLLLLPVFPMLLAAYFPGRIQRTLKHPMLVAVKLWALSHLLVNGMAHDVVLFGSFLAWAVVDRISLKRRTPRAIPALPGGRFNDAIVVIAGLAIYGAFITGGHRLLIGVDPIAF